MITSGTLLIAGDAPRPRCFEVDAGLYPNAWMPVRQTLTPRQLEKELSAAGWTFFFMAGPIRAKALGFNRDKTIDAALKRGIEATRELGSNCLQIESLETRSFLGIASVRMWIRPRHIQRGTLFAGAAPAHAADIATWEPRRKVAAT
jgi:hypothetical protein